VEESYICHIYVKRKVAWFLKIHTRFLWIPSQKIYVILNFLPSSCNLLPTYSNNFSPYLSSSKSVFNYSTIWSFSFSHALTIITAKSYALNVYFLNFSWIFLFSHKLIILHLWSKSISSIILTILKIAVVVIVVDWT